MAVGNFRALLWYTSNLVVPTFEKIGGSHAPNGPKLRFSYLELICMRSKLIG